MNFKLLPPLPRCIHDNREIYGYIYHEVWHNWVSYLFQKIQLQESYVSNIFKTINYKWQTVIGEQKK